MQRPHSILNLRAHSVKYISHWYNPIHVCEQSQVYKHMSTSGRGFTETAIMTKTAVLPLMNLVTKARKSVERWI